MAHVQINPMSREDVRTEFDRENYFNDFFFSWYVLLDSQSTR